MSGPVHIDDALNFIVDCVKKPRPKTEYSNYGYEVFMTDVIRHWLVEMEGCRDNSDLRSGPRAKELSPIFYEAAWELSRRGILRPGLIELGSQPHGFFEGYSVTALGRSLISQDPPAFIAVNPTRLAELFRSLADVLGDGFLQRANEAAQCHAFCCYVACCAMCGAAAESILLAIAIAKSRDEAATLKTYRSTHGRSKTIDAIVAGVRDAIARPVHGATSLLSYWRDNAAHGVYSTISEIEAHEALGRLIRFAQFTRDNWKELTR